MAREVAARKAFSLLSAPKWSPKLRNGARSRFLPSSRAAMSLDPDPNPTAAKRALPTSHFPRSPPSPRSLLPLSHAAAALFSTTSTPSRIPRRRRREAESELHHSTVEWEDEEEAEPVIGNINPEECHIEIEGGDSVVEWEEEEEEAEPVIGDGGDGGGVVLGDAKWGERALAVAHEVLRLHFGEDMVMFAFKVSPRGYIYVRLDKLTNKYGCPTIEEIENFNSLYKKQLDGIIECGEIPLDLALEVSSPGAERLLKVPDDLDRFKDMPMNVQYLEEDLSSRNHQQKEGVFMLELIDTETGQCVWRLADVRENRAESGKGRPLSRKQKDWRIRLPYEAMKRVTLYLTS